MPRGRSPNRDKAFEIYKEHGGNITNREIAALLGEDEKVIAVWKSRDKWNVVQQTSERCTTKAKGGQPGNKNAVGHGGTGPPGNKNAVTTGEFETLLFDCLEPEEQRLTQTVPEDKQKLLMQEIQLLTVRERRMLKRIDLLRNSLDDSGVASCDETGMTAVGHRKGIEKDKETDLLEYRGKLGQIQNIEDALTRVQARKQAAIDALHRYGVDDARLEIEMKRLDLAEMKLTGQGQEIEDLEEIEGEIYGSGEENL